MKYSILLALSLALVLPLQAGNNKKAGGHAKPKATPQQVFKKKDKDNDGFLSKDEFSAKAKDSAKASKVFNKRDKNNDGKLALKEFTGKAGKAGKAKGGKAKAGKGNKKTK